MKAYWKKLEVIEIRPETKWSNYGQVECAVIGIGRLNPNM